MTRETMRQIAALPNIYGYFRILLIPEFIWLTLAGERYAALGILALSGISDLLDGAAARGLGMVTPLGRALDPVADKLTQLAVLACLTLRYADLVWLLMILTLKEAAAALGGLFLLASGGQPFSSMWFGKLSSFSLYSYLGFLLAFEPPRPLVSALGGCVAAVLLLSGILYTAEFFRRIPNARSQG